MFDLEDVLCILEVAKAKNITKAAAKLYLSQPALSQKITKVEKALGFPLFIRTNRFVELTEAGQLFVENGTRILSQWDEFLSNMRQFSTSQKKISVSFHPTAVYTDIPQVITDFSILHPECQVDITTASANPISNQRNAQVDFAFVRTSSDGIRHSNTCPLAILEEDTLCLLLHKDDPLAQSTEFVYSSQLSGYICVADCPENTIGMPPELDVSFAYCSDSIMPSRITRPGYCAFVPRSACAAILNQYPNLVARPFENNHAITLYMSYREKAYERSDFYAYVINYYNKKHTRQQSS